MVDEALKEVLCIPGKRRNYAVEFPYVEEICKDVMISLMPCLPEHFAGVCNYKGSIVPVVCQEGPEPGRGRGGRQADGTGPPPSEILSGYPFVSGTLSDPDEQG